MRLAQWHLDPGNHPLKLYIDQEKQLYVKVVYNNAVYQNTKKSGRFVPITLPQYKPTDSVWIEGFQDDRLEDTILNKGVYINSLKGNHPLKIEDKRGNVIIQVVYEDFPGRPRF